MRKFILLSILMCLMITSSFAQDEPPTESHSTHYIDDITITTEYKEGYNFDAKAIEFRSVLIEANMISNDDNRRVWINQVYAEAFVLHSYSCLNNQVIDTMNDKVEGNSDTYGFSFSIGHGYHEEWFVNRVFVEYRQENQYGYCELSEKQINDGFQGISLLIDYDLMIEDPLTKEVYKESFVDRKAFDKNGTIVDNADVTVEATTQNTNFLVGGGLVAITMIVYYNRKK